MLRWAANTASFGLLEFADPLPEMYDSGTDVELEIRYDRDGNLRSTEIIRGQDAVASGSR